ncbi:MAG: phosphogluconate dehydratase, partial [Betaproteobacteria bacterium]|nr:phosphogluconate dehydratase [Betaproteobacteria bacterium]
MTLNATVAQVTARIAKRSQVSRATYLQQVEEAAARKPGADRLGCANVAHAFAAMPPADKSKASGLAAIPVVSATERAPNIGVVTAYNDLLSAHAPFQHYPDVVKDEARKWGA